MGEVIYTNDDNYIEVRWVPDYAQPEQYQWGVLLGPPDLTSLDLPEEQVREVNNRLATAMIYDLHTLTGRRGELVRILEDVGVDDVSAARNAVISLYQQELYPEQFGG
ncbi:MAG TPA: hypothetical protein PKD55_00270 [Bellilinea sp.]|nr:hypothetical protein [Bellilinea sp.]